MRVRTKLYEELGQVKWIASLPSDEQKVLQRSVTVVDVEEGRQLCHSGQSERESYLLLSGTAEVRHGGESVATLEVGDFFGEIAPLGDVPRVADVWATSDVTLGVMTELELMLLIEDCPVTARRLIRRVGRLAAAGLSTD